MFETSVETRSFEAWTCFSVCCCYHAAQFRCRRSTISSSRVCTSSRARNSYDSSLTYRSIDTKRRQQTKRVDVRQRAVPCPPLSPKLIPPHHYIYFIFVLLLLCNHLSQPIQCHNKRRRRRRFIMVVVENRNIHIFYIQNSVRFTFNMIIIQ